MSIAFQLAFRNMDASEAAEALVRQRADELQHYGYRITACRVVLDCAHRQNPMGRLYSVHIELTLPGGPIMVNRDQASNHAHDDLHLAIRDAFDTVRRKLQAMKETPMRRRREARRTPGLPAADEGVSSA